MTRDSGVALWVVRVVLWAIFLGGFAVAFIYSVPLTIRKINETEVLLRGSSISLAGILEMLYSLAALAVMAGIFFVLYSLTSGLETRTETPILPKPPFAYRRLSM